MQTTYNPSDYQGRTKEQYKSSMIGATVGFIGLFVMFLIGIIIKIFS